MDPQYVTAMLLDDKAEFSARMVSLISDEAEKSRRKRVPALGADAALARAITMWHSSKCSTRPTQPDKLHQSNWSTLRVSRALCEAIIKVLPPMALSARTRRLRGQIAKICRSFVSQRQNHAPIPHDSSDPRAGSHHDETSA
jgi:hypothetical protein